MNPSLIERILARLPDLSRFVGRRLGPELRQRESASDIVQSTVRELLASGRFEDRGEDSLRAWLEAAAEHKIQNRARRWRTAARGARGEVPFDDAESSLRSPSGDAAIEEDKGRLERALEALPATSRLALERVQLQGQSYAEVAEELGKSPEAVRKLVARALARLSTLLSEG